MRAKSRCPPICHQYSQGENVNEQYQYQRRSDDCAAVPHSNQQDADRHAEPYLDGLARRGGIRQRGLLVDCNNHEIRQGFAVHRPGCPRPRRSMVDVAYTAMNSAIDVVNSIKSKLVAAREPGVDKAKVQTEITQLQKQLTSIAGPASFSGQNWLNVDSSAAGFHATKSIILGFTRTGSADSVKAIDIAPPGMDLFN